MFQKRSLGNDIKWERMFGSDLNINENFHFKEKYTDVQF